MPQIPRPSIRLHGAATNGDRAQEPVNRELIAERDRLLEKFTVMQADLGGAFYEMAIRDHVKLDVLTRKAAELQRVDIELGQIEEALARSASAATGECTSCGTPYEPGARFCSHCGNQVAKD